MKALTIVISSLCMLSVASCETNQPLPATTSWDKIKQNWSGSAEISRYELKQNRYGKLENGEAMMIYVREPFLKGRQVKDESGAGNFEVLKLNATRSFVTGIYPYHTMISIFQPLEEKSVGKALKVTTSVQDWCGHVFTQSNRKNSFIHTEVKSYFENEEGNSYKEKASVLLEDEVWTAIRLSPTELPVGKLKIIPGSLHTRFSHTDPKPLEATAKWKSGHSGDTVIYEINYSKTGRSLAIEIKQQAPYFIQSWHEANAKGLISSGKLTHQLTNVEYWDSSDPAKSKKIRKQLGLK